ncbi:hypothetical protein [Streptomyces sp. NPDC007346]|uniref:hypothetical protein n=1 Tax=Streptomyces sp. NPDC007346 TaxID=3154682 RepID=UPI0034542BFD
MLVVGLRLLLVVALGLLPVVTLALLPVVAPGLLVMVGLRLPFVSGRWAAFPKCGPVTISPS